MIGNIKKEKSCLPTLWQLEVVKELSGFLLQQDGLNFGIIVARV